MNVQVKPEWEIEFEEFLRRLNFTTRKFKESLELPPVNRVKRVLPLRDIAKIVSVIPMSESLLFKMISGVQTNDKQQPFKDASLKIINIDPLQVKIGQKFAYMENWVRLMQDLPGLFSAQYAMGHGIIHLGAFTVFGNDASGEEALAFYVPPIVEQHGNNLVIMDGIHRNYIVKQIGASILAVEVKNVSASFPCSCQEWSELRCISLMEKPKDINERYFDLKVDLFRDLKYFGIDG